MRDFGYRTLGYATDAGGGSRAQLARPGQARGPQAVTLQSELVPVPKLRTEHGAAPRGRMASRRTEEMRRTEVRRSFEVGNRRRTRLRGVGNFLAYLMSSRSVSP